MSDNPERGIRRRRTWACAAVAFVVGASIGALHRAATDTDAAAAAAAASVVTIDGDGFRYAYHATTGTEALFDVTNDPRLIRNVIANNRTLALSMRRRLEARLGVDDLESLRRLHSEAIARLQSLGYL